MKLKDRLLNNCSESFAFLFTIGLLLLIIFPKFLANGMCLDGIVYSELAHRMHVGSGTFWHPVEYYGIEQPFLGHPPLAFALQSLFFYIFGDNLYADKFYSLVTFILSVFLLTKIWREVTGSRKSTWFPFFLLILMPLSTWAIPNNILENTMMVFVLLAIWLILKSFSHHRFLYLIFAGFCLYLTFITKYFTGLFPIVLPFIYCLIKKDMRLSRGIADSLFLLFSFVAVFGLFVLIFPESWQSFKTIIEVQIAPSFRGEACRVKSRFFIVGILLVQFVIPAAVCLVIYLLNLICQKRKKIPISPNNTTWGIVFLVLGFCASLPIMLTTKQHKMYILCSLPCFALSLALLFQQSVESLSIFVSRNLKLAGFIVSVVLLCTAVLLNISHIGSYYGRHKEILTDIECIAPVVPRQTIVETYEETMHNYSLRYYFSRLHDITLWGYYSTPQGCPFFLCPKGEAAPDGYQYIKLPTTCYDLYQLSE